MKIAIIGAGGFLGKALTSALAKNGHEVNAVARRWPSDAVDSFPPGVDPLEADATDALRLYEHMRGCVLVYFLAYDGVPLSDDADFISEYRSNILLLTSTMLAAERAGALRLIFVSSGGTVYGNAGRLPIEEDTVLAPISHYGNVKQLSENLVASYCRIARSFEFVTARLSNPFGPQQIESNRTGLIVSAIKCVLSGSPMMVLGEGRQVRDYVYIDDAVRGLEVLGMHGGVKGECYNVGSGVGHSVRSILAMVEEVTGRTLRIAHGAARSKDVECNILSIEKLAKATGWRPAHSCRQGIELTWNALVNTWRPKGAAKFGAAT